MRKRIGRLGDAATDVTDPYAGSAYYGGQDTFYQDNPDYVYTPDPNDVGLLQSFINDFQEKVAQLDAQIAALNEAQTRLDSVHDIAAQNPDDLAAWQSEYNKVNAINTTIQAAQSAVAQISDWWQSVKGVVGLSGASRGARDLLHGALGVLPFAIPWGIVATIAGAVAAIAAVVASVNALIDRLNIKNWNDENIRRSQEGLPPLPKPEMSGQSVFGDLSDMGRTITFAVIAYLLLPPLLKRLER